MTDMKEKLRILLTQDDGEFTKACAERLQREGCEVITAPKDGVRLAEMILAEAPDAALFTKAFRDTTWTNDWVPFTQRGIIVK